jgi:SAM-dependent methyltransferase
MSLKDGWGSGSAYEPFVGRWSRLVASRFVDWLAPRPERRWLEVGCGTGALTETILQAGDPALVHGLDPSSDYVEYARSRIADARVEFSVGDALGLPDGGFDYTVSGLVLNFLADPADGLQEMKRVTRPEGCIAAYLWDYSSGMEMLRYFWDAARELDEEAARLDEGVRFSICNPDSLRSLWDGADLGDVAVVPVAVDTHFRDFDDFWLPFLGGQGPASTYTMSLAGPAREELKSLLRQRLPVGDDGGIELCARAWGVRGTA